MKQISNKRCVIGEGPIWNEFEQKLYFVNGRESEICIFDFLTERLDIRNIRAAAIAFDAQNNMYISTRTGIFRLNKDNSFSEIYDTSRHSIKFGNDMKVGPDGRLYVGTLSLQKAGVSDDIDGKLCSIDKDGNVRVLLDNLIVPNGMDWSMDEKRFYFTDSDTGYIREYSFDKASGQIEYTGRKVRVCGVDGFTIDKNDNLVATSWGQGCIAIVSTKTMEITDYINVPAQAPASCGFCGKNMDKLAIVTATFNRDISTDTNAGYTYITEYKTGGRLPYLFGGN